VKITLVLLFLLLSRGSLPFVQAKTQVQVDILEQSADYLFDDWLHFYARYESSEGLQEGFVFYQYRGSERAWVFEGELSEEQALDVQVELNEENSPPPFTELEYWYRFASDRGEIIESQHYTLYYDDNRYAWQHQESPPFLLYWHHGDLAFGQSILAAARQGVTRAQELLALPDLENAVLRVYDDEEDVQGIARQAGFIWQAGHTDPQGGLILLALPPGPQQNLEVQRQVPHEVGHLMLYRSLGPAYYRLPDWLNEGFASNVEIYSDPAQSEMLASANAADDLIPLFSLCHAFPQDRDSARLAYAQSTSFVRYLFERYNSVGFGLLVDAYSTNDDCLEAPVQVFGKDLNAMEAEWRTATFDQDQGVMAWVSTAPWQAMIVSAGLALAIFLLLRSARLGRGS